jgi:hypothetical protein
MAKDKLSNLQNMAGAVTMAAASMFANTAQAQSAPPAPGPGAHQAIAQKCMTDLIMKGVTDPKQVQACMTQADRQVGRPNHQAPTQPPAAPTRSPQELARQTAECRTKTDPNEQLACIRGLSHPAVREQVERSVNQGKVGDIAIDSTIQWINNDIPAGHPQACAAARDTVRRMDQSSPRIGEVRAALRNKCGPGAGD